MLDDGAPQDQDVDARIIARGERIARQAGSGGRAPTFGASPPRLDPRQAPGLQLGNDARCDLVIEACTVLGLPIFARTLAAGTAAGGFPARMSVRRGKGVAGRV